MNEKNFKCAICLARNDLLFVDIHNNCRFKGKNTTVNVYNSLYFEKKLNFLEQWEFFFQKKNVKYRTNCAYTHTFIRPDVCRSPKINTKFVY